MSARQLLCPHCRVRLSTSAPVGETIACPACHDSLVVPPRAVPGAEWYVSREGHRAGPITWSRLVHAAVTGDVKPSDFVWGPTLTSWIEAHSLPGLFPVSPPAATPLIALPPTLCSEDTSADIFEDRGATQEEKTGPLSMRGIRPSSLRSITLGDFQILRKLGTGAMGAVYLARQRSQQRPVALKVLSRHLSDHPEYVDRFYREAEVMARLQHANIVQLYGVGEEQSMYYFAMEYIDGFTLAVLLNQRGGQLAVGDALHIILRSVAALGYAHEHGIVHRDIKPSNIMVNQLGHVKLTDMGLAKPLDEDVSLTESGLGLGTPQYMSPEQARSAKYADRRSDIYSLGCVLYRMLTGVLPFEQESAMELLLAKEQGTFPSARRRNQDVPPRLDLIIDKMLAKAPRSRYQTCAELQRDLEGLALAHEHLSFNLLHAAGPPAAPAGDPAAPRVEVLLADEDPGAILLAQEALAESGTPSNLSVVGDLEDALAFLLRQVKYPSAPCPNLIVVGEGLFERGGVDFILAVKTRSELRRIPLIVLTRSDQAVDLLQTRGIGTNLEIRTPEDLKSLQQLLIESENDSTVTVVKLPKE